MPETRTKPPRNVRAPSRPLTLPPTDIRRKRPPALSFLLRMDTLRRCARVLTLLALVLAIGIVVDDAIVVVENVERNIEAGLSPRDHIEAILRMKPALDGV